MSSHKQYLFKPLAEQDLEGIYDFTVREFGETQAGQYIQVLFEKFQILSETPVIAKKRDEVRTGLRSYPVNAHIVFFREISDGILIVRVLHQSMDYESKQYD